MIEFDGVLAVIGSPSADGRVITSLDPELTRPLPLPLVPGAVTGSPCGKITQVWVEGDQLKYTVEVPEDHPLLGKIRSGELVGMLDAEISGAVDTGSDGQSLEMTGVRVVGATLLPSHLKVWPEVELSERRIMSTFPEDPSGAHEVAPPPEADETNTVEQAASHDEPHPSTDE